MTGWDIGGGGRRRVVEVHCLRNAWLLIGFLQGPLLNVPVGGRVPTSTGRLLLILRTILLSDYCQYDAG